MELESSTRVVSVKDFILFHYKTKNGRGTGASLVDAAGVEQVPAYLQNPNNAFVLR
jgi:hypothetical protein